MEVALIVTLAGLILTALNIADKIYTNKNRIKKDGAKEAVTEVDISTIKQGNASILVQLEKMDTKMDNFKERLIIVEESTKHAHKRLDTLEGQVHG